jgi:hypothetical protein
VAPSSGRALTLSRNNISVSLISDLATTFFPLYGAIMLILNNVFLLMISIATDFICSSCLGVAVCSSLYYPLSRLYRNFAALAGFLMCLPVIFVRAQSLLQSSGKSFIVIFYVFELILLSSVIPVVAWWLHNRFHAGLTLHSRGTR